MTTFEQIGGEDVRLLVRRKINQINDRWLNCLNCGARLGVTDLGNVDYSKYNKFMLEGTFLIRMNCWSCGKSYSDKVTRGSKRIK